MEIVLANRAEERPRLLKALQDFARQHELPASVLQAVDLALEEHLTNILNYAYDGSEPHSICVRLVAQSGWLLVEVEDDGKPFNPLERPAPDTSAPLESRPIGGLGIHLIRKFMDDVGYRRERDLNILTMRKQLPAA